MLISYFVDVFAEICSLNVSLVLFIYLFIIIVTVFMVLSHLKEIFSDLF